MHKTQTLFEYDHLCADPGLEGIVPIDESTFEALELFLASLAAGSEDTAEEMHDVFRLSSRRGRKTLAVQNYVGVISAADTAIEVLPKIGRPHRDSVEDVERVRSVLLSMLSELRDTQFKNLGRTGLATAKMPVLEVFISAFLDEVREILRRGIRSDYRDWAGNERFLKGKLNFSEHVRLNHTDRSRFAVEYSVYHVDRPENRLIKSTLDYLGRQSHDSVNKRRIKIALDHLTEVGKSPDTRGDFAACKNDRNTAHYANALMWCRIFLGGEAPTSFPGIVTADALLFPMERIFEDYVAARLLKTCRPHGIAVQAQDRGHYLFDSPKQYRLRPDIVVTDPVGRRIILDTKWKIPKDGKPGQGDMYQMFAYAARYGVDDVTLVYPVTGDGPCGEREIYRTTVSGRTVRVHTYFYRLPEDALADTTFGDGADELARYIENLTKCQAITATPTS